MSLLCTLLFYREFSRRDQLFSEIQNENLGSRLPKGHTTISAQTHAGPERRTLRNSMKVTQKIALFYIFPKVFSAKNPVKLFWDALLKKIFRARITRNYLKITYYVELPHLFE